MDTAVVSIDSLTLQPDSIPPTLITESLFSNHQLQVQSFELAPLENGDYNWLFFWMASLGILLLINRLVFPRQSHFGLTAIFRARDYTQLRYEGVFIKQFPSILSSVIYVFSLGLLMSVISTYYFGNNDIYRWDINMSITFSLLILGLIIIKLLTILGNHFIFQNKELAIQHLNYSTLSYNVMGFGIFAGLWIILYINVLVGLLLTSTFIALIMMLRLVKLVGAIGLKNNFNLYKFIIYLCTVEILPLIIAQKLYFDWFLKQ